jgi:glycosyltransferase involved in cell wall biosynthesis
MPSRSEFGEGLCRHRCLELIDVEPEGSGALGYALEYSIAIFWETLFVWRVFFRLDFDVVHVNNPPDILFLVGGLFKVIFSKKLVFDHHDLCPELYEAKFGRKGLPFWILRRLERWSIKAADIVISTNDGSSNRSIAPRAVCGLPTLIHASTS